MEVWKYDGGLDQQDHYRFAPGEVGDGDMWLPWADNADQYARKHAVIAVEVNR